MVYNLTNITAGNETGILQFVSGVNINIGGGNLINMFLLGLSVIFFMSFFQSTNSIPKSLIGTFMIIFVLSLSLVALGLVHQLVPFIALALLVIGIVFSYGSD